MDLSAHTAEALYSSLGGDTDLAEIVEMFVDEMPDRIGTFIDCLETGDWEGLGRAAHQMKGAGGSYGFDQLTPYAAKLESAVRDQEPEEEIRQALNALVSLCQKVRAGVPG